MQHIYNNRSYQCLTGLIAVDLTVFLAVDPYDSNAVWLIIGYGLLALTILAVLRIVRRLISTTFGQAGKTGARLTRYTGIVLICLVGLQSVGQLTPRDSITLLVLATLAYWYFGYGAGSKTEKVGT